MRELVNYLFFGGELFQLTTFTAMKLSQFHNTTLTTFEIKDSSLLVTERSILKKRTQEILFQDILIKDVYDFQHHDRYALGYIFVGITFFVTFAVEYALNTQHANWKPTAVSGIVTLIFISRYMIPIIKIHVPTKNQGMIRFHKNKPSKKSVDEFIYVLEGKVNLVAKKTPEKEDLSQFLKIR